MRSIEYVIGLLLTRSSGIDFDSEDPEYVEEDKSSVKVNKAFSMYHANC